MIVYAVIFISLALILYTVGVWSSVIKKDLKKWHLVTFWLGFISDTLGTAFMNQMVKTVFTTNFHGITGILAISLMLINAIWATKVLNKDHPAGKIKFHKYSVVVWGLWLVPYVSGMVFGMMN